MAANKAASKIVRVSVGTMLLEQDKTSRAIQDTFEDATQKAAAESEKKRRGDVERRTALMALLLRLTPRLVAETKASILEGRQGARDAAGKRAVKELAAAGLVVKASDLGSGRPSVVAAEQARRWVDEVAAEAAAHSLVTQWRSVAVYSASTGRDLDATTALARTPRLMKARIDRTATTEVSLAYNDEHEELLSVALRYDDALRGEVDGLRIVREWSAMADACNRCWPLDGEQAGIDESFPSGEEPGDVHPNCQCIEFYTTAS